MPGAVPGISCCLVNLCRMNNKGCPGLVVWKGTGGQLVHPHRQDYQEHLLRRSFSYSILTLKVAATCTICTREEQAQISSVPAGPLLVSLQTSLEAGIQVYQTRHQFSRGVNLLFSLFSS